MRSAWRIFLPIFAVLALFFVAIFGVAVARNGIHSALRPSILFADMKTTFQRVFGGSQKTLLEIPNETSEQTAIKSEPCAYETLTKRKQTGVIFNEIAWMGTKANYNAEWMELKNISGNPIDISLWQLIDTDERIRVVIPQGTKISQGGFFLLTREVKKDGIPGNLSYTGMLRNTGTGIRLFNSGCELEDEILKGDWPAGNNKTKQTMARNKNGLWVTAIEIGGTPGKENDGSAQGSVSQVSRSKNNVEIVEQKGDMPTSSVIIFPASTTLVSEEKTRAQIFMSEVSPGSAASTDDEFIELYNPNNFSVSLSGWSVKKKTNSAKISTLVSSSRLEGKTIPANSYFLIGREGGYGGNVPADALWAKSNILAYENNTLLLFDSAGNQIDMLGWTEIPKGKSLLRALSGNEARVGERSPKSANGF
jgi:hypothetical protein